MRLITDQWAKHMKSFKQNAVGFMSANSINFRLQLCLKCYINIMMSERRMDSGAYTTMGTKKIPAYVINDGKLSHCCNPINSPITRMAGLISYCPHRPQVWALNFKLQSKWDFPRAYLQRRSLSEVPLTVSLQYECTFHCYLWVEEVGEGSHAISVCNMFSWGYEIARLVIALGQARMVLLVNHEGNKTDKKKARETHLKREGDFLIF